MESADSHHQFQDQFLASSSYGSVGTHPWTTTTVPNSILNTNSLSSSSQENSTTTLHPSNMAPDLSFHWANNSNTASSFSTNLSPQYLHLSRIKDELSEHYYRKYTEILSSSSPQSTTTDEYNLHENDVGTKLLFKSFSSGNLMNKVVNSTNGTHGDFYSGNGVRSGFVSQIFPSINISSNDLNHQHPAGAASSLDMNLDALDLLASSRSFNGNFDHSSQNQAGIFRDGFLNYGFDHMQQSHQIPLLYGSNKVSGSSNVVGEAKRTSSKISNMEPKAPIQNAPKKSRVEARASCPPFKVRKEKLGDRIAALQQLVAPFGKTDTASVLMEAIGYIKFLQSQVETLSVPYMKASRNKSGRVMKGGPAENETEEPKRDLKGRGLCLVPLSCLSYITDGGGAAVWPPPHFGGAT